MRRPLLALLLAAAPLSAAAETALPPALQSRVDRAAEDCKSLDGGVFSYDPGAVSRPDLNGDGTPDWAMDESGFQCSTAASYFCGSGGCVTAFVIGDVETEIFGHGWQMAQTPVGPVVLSFVGGADCGLAEAAACVRALVWGEGRWNTQPTGD